MYKIFGVDETYETREEARDALISIEDRGMVEIEDIVNKAIEKADGLTKIQLKKGWDFIQECITTTTYDYENGFDPLEEHYNFCITKA